MKSGWAEAGAKWTWFRPRMAGAHFRDRLLAFCGVSISIGLTFAICARFLPGEPGLPAIVAPLGASAVMVFVIPSSPLAQPWRVLGGNVLSTLIGIAFVRMVPNVVLAASFAVGTAILVMSVLRCLHPPGGAAALTAVIGGPEVHAAGYAFAFMPVAVNSLILVLLAVAFHRLTGRSYPHGTARESAAPEAGAFHSEDIDRALEDLRETFDISRDDLQQLLSRAEFHALQRRRGRR